MPISESVRRVGRSTTRARTSRRSCSRRTWSASSLMRYDVVSSATVTAQLAIRDVFVDTWLLREPERALAQHVPVHLAGATADRAREVFEQLEGPFGEE